MFYAYTSYRKFMVELEVLHIHIYLYICIYTYIRYTHIYWWDDSLQTVHTHSVFELGSTPGSWWRAREAYAMERPPKGGGSGAPFHGRASPPTISSFRCGGLRSTRQSPPIRGTILPDLSLYIYIYLSMYLFISNLFLHLFNCSFAAFAYRVPSTQCCAGKLKHDRRVPFRRTVASFVDAWFHCVLR